MFTEQLPCNRLTASYYRNTQVNTAELLHFEERATKCMSTQEGKINSGWGRNIQVLVGNLGKINGKGFKKHLKRASQNKQDFNTDRQKYTTNQAFYNNLYFISQFF